MIYTIIFSQTAKKQLKKLNKKTKERILGVLQRCKVRPYAHIKKLIENPYFSLRAGDYRLILRIVNNQLIIIVIEIKHRKNIYKKH